MMKDDVKLALSLENLGVTIQSHRRFNCCVEERLEAFYRSLIAILLIEGRSNELVMVMESHCVPMFTYRCIDVIHGCGFRHGNLE